MCAHIYRHTHAHTHSSTPRRPAITLRNFSHHIKSAAPSGYGQTTTLIVVCRLFLVRLALFSAISGLEAQTLSYPSNAQANAINKDTYIFYFSIFFNNGAYEFPIISLCLQGLFVEVNEARPCLPARLPSTEWAQAIVNENV